MLLCLLIFFYIVYLGDFDLEFYEKIIEYIIEFKFILN